MFSKFLVVIGAVILISCNNSANSGLENSKQDTNEKFSTSDFQFNGVSIFTKDETMGNIKRALNKTNIYFTQIPISDYPYFNDSKINCCSNNKVLYIPNYKFGLIYINDLFLLFINDSLSQVESRKFGDINEDYIQALQDLYYTKYGAGDTINKVYSESTINETILYKNRRDHISIQFSYSKKTDSFKVNSEREQSRIMKGLNYDKEIIDRIRKKYDRSVQTDSIKSYGGWEITDVNIYPRIIESVSKVHIFKVSFLTILGKCCSEENQKRELQNRKDSIEFESQKRKTLEQI